MAFIAAWAIGGQVTDGYQPTRHAISRLAAVGADTRSTMTVGFVVFAAGAVAASLALRRALPGPTWLAVAATGAATAGVALTPLDRSDAVDVLHGLAATVGYVAFVAAAALAVRPLRTARRPGLAAASAAAAALGGTCLVLTSLAAVDGLTQRAGLTVLDLWLTAVSLAVLLGRLAPSEPD